MAQTHFAQTLARVLVDAFDIDLQIYMTKTLERLRDTGIGGEFVAWADAHRKSFEVLVRLSSVLVRRLPRTGNLVNDELVELIQRLPFFVRSATIGANFSASAGGSGSSDANADFSRKYEEAVESLSDEDLFEVATLNHERLKKWVNAPRRIRPVLLKLWRSKKTPDHADSTTDELPIHILAKIVSIYIGFLDAAITWTKFRELPDGTLPPRGMLFHYSEAALPEIPRRRWQDAKTRWPEIYNFLKSLVDDRGLEELLDGIVDTMKNVVTQAATKERLDQFTYKHLLHTWLAELNEADRELVRKHTQHTEEDAIRAYEEFATTIAALIVESFTDATPEKRNSLFGNAEPNAVIKEFIMAVRPIVAIEAQVVVSHVWPDSRKSGSDLVLPGLFGEPPKSWREVVKRFDADEKKWIGRVREIASEPEKSRQLDEEFKRKMDRLAGRA